MTRRLIALLAALCFLLSLTAAADVQPKGVFPVVDEPTTLRVAVVLSSAIPSAMMSWLPTPRPESFWR
mgnify:CR=1 FL=1